MNTDVRLWEELSKEEKDKIAMMRFRHAEEEQLKSLQSLLKTPPEVIESLNKFQDKFNKEWQSKEFQVSEAMDGANKNFYYTNIEKGYTEYHLSKMIDSLWEDEELELEKTIRKHKYNSNLKTHNSEEQIKYLKGIVINLKSEILDDCSFGCEWYQDGTPDINELSKLCRWYNESDFESLITALVVIDDIQDYINELEYPDEDRLRSQKHINRKMAADQAIINDVVEWISECLSQNVTELDATYIKNIILKFWENGIIPHDIKPIQIIKDEVTYTPKLLANDLRTFMWVIWYKYKKIRKINQLVIAELLLNLFPSSFMQDGELTKVESIKQHFGDNKGTKIKIPDYIKEEQKYK